MPVIVKPLLPEQGEEALSFIEPYESECVNLASELLRGGTDCWALYYVEQAQAGNGAQAQDSRGQKIAGSSPAMTDDAMSFPRSDNLSFPRSDAGIFQDKKLAGLIALRKKRSLFFCLPFAKYKSAFDKKVCSEAQRPLMEFFESNEPFCINGEAAGSIFLCNILKNKKSPMRPSVTNKYFLMTRDCDQNCSQDQNGGAETEKASQDLNAGGGSGLAKDLRVVALSPLDYSRALPLELGYQREEVVPASFDISDAALAAAFKRDLADGNHYALEISGEFAAMAKVTSQGRRFAMLGGVYTIPPLRKKGLARFLVRQIIALPSLACKNFSLYAKQENAAALALYKSLGFTPRGEYLLIYY